MADVLSGTFSGTGQSSSVAVNGPSNLSLTFSSTGTVALERSFDQGTSWKPVQTYTGSAEAVIDEPKGASYRLNCSAISGTIGYRIG